MKKILLSVIAASVFFVAAAVALTSSTPDISSQGTQSASPSQSSPPDSPTIPPTSSPTSSTQASHSSQGSGIGSSTSPQATGMGSQGADNSSGSMGGMKNDSGTKNESVMKGDKKLKGCIQSSGGQYLLEEKKGKMVNLNSSQDLSAHVGHMVAVRGIFAAKGSSDTASTSSSSPSNAGSGRVFYVDSVDMISDTCPASKNKASSGSMGNSNSGSSTQP